MKGTGFPRLKGQAGQPSSLSIETGEQLLELLKEAGVALQLKDKPKKDPVDLSAVEKKQQKIIQEVKRRNPELQSTEIATTSSQQADAVRDELDLQRMSKQEKHLLRNLSTADNTLNQHVLGNIPLKAVDFSKPQVYSLLKLKKPDSKKQHYEQMLEKLRIMFELTYSQEDFALLKYYNLNSDQLLTILKASNFLECAEPPTIIDCLKSLQKSRQIKVYSSRPEVVAAIQKIALDPAILKELPQSYVATLMHCTSRMAIDDEIIWFSLAEHLSTRHDQFTIRSLSTMTYALTMISKHKPVILNFDNLYKRLELSFIKKFTENFRQVKGQDVSITLTSYSKSQNGSVQFWRAMEGIVIQNQQKMSTQELSNVIYSYSRADNAERKHLFEELKPQVCKIMHKMKPVELCQVLMAFTECQESLTADEEPLMDAAMIERFESEFKGRFEAMNPSDTSQYYFCFTKLGFVGEGLFYKYLQKAVSKTIRAFEGPHLRLMFHKFDEVDSMRLNKGVQRRLIEHCKWLMREKKLKGFDAYHIYQHTSKLPYEATQYQNEKIHSPTRKNGDSSDQSESESQDKQFKYHDLHIQLRSYLEKLNYHK